MDEKEKEKALLVQTNFTCNFVFESGESSLSISAPSAEQAGAILRELLRFKKIKDTLGEVVE